MASLTARITARDTDSTVPDQAGAVDADILIGDALVCRVTLIPDPQTGKLSVWGCPDNWCSDIDAACAALDCYPPDAADLIERAVRDAA